MLDQTNKTVRVMVYVNDDLVEEYTNAEVPAYAVNYVIGAVIVQVQDPDLEAAQDL